jgi:hypothetical protein
MPRSGVFTDEETRPSTALVQKAPRDTKYPFDPDYARSNQRNEKDLGVAMTAKSLSWPALLLAVGLSILLGHRAFAQDATPATLPAGVTACQFDALSNPPNGEKDLILRDAPRSDANVLAPLPAVEVANADFTVSHREVPQFRVIGFADGWFLIEGAHYPEASQPLYAGQGWVGGQFITTRLYRDTLKKAPGHAADDVVYLNGEDTDGVTGNPYSTPVSRIMGCSGPWFEVQSWLPGAKTPSGKPAAGNSMVRGWTDRSCVRQDGPCRKQQFDYPWSPLPAGVTECNFGALSNDPDPLGLNVREAPDRNARVIGHVQTPTYLSRDTKVLANVQVIGYKKGWFLVELGPYDPADLPPHGPKPYTGRGWVAGNMLTTELLRDMLKQEPSEKSADVINLEVDDDRGNVSNPQAVKMRRILACSGDWVQVEIALVKGMKPIITTDAPQGAVRGWSNGTCTNQLTTCDFSGDTPWSPPAPLPPE